jgi:hypothetical protein
MANVRVPTTPLGAVRAMKRVVAGPWTISARSDRVGGREEPES